MARDMGLGTLAATNTIFKRKYRWTFSLSTPCGVIPDTVVKVANRPQLDIEDTQIDYLHGRMWIPGKASWQTTSVTFYDVLEKGGAGKNDITNLYKWLSGVYAFHSNVTLHQSSVRGGYGPGSGALGASILTSGGLGGPPGYSGTAFLNMYDGSGEVLEQWVLGHVWPQSISFGELDYSSSDEATVEVTLRYSEVQYNPMKIGCVTPFVPCPPAGCST
jgi:hypothetical protein